MKFNKALLLLSIVFIAIGSFTPALAGTPHTAYGKIFNSDSSVPADGDITFNAYITTRPDEIQTESSTGSSYSGGYWSVGVGNFSTDWSPGEILRVDATNTANGETGSVEVVMTDAGSDEAEDMYLEGSVDPPNADFSGTPTSGDKPLDVTFTDESTGEVTSWSWDFGDGNSSTEQNPVHTYQDAGTYTVALTVTGPGGSDTETKIDYITVTTPAPVADFSGTPTSGDKPLDVTFADESTGEVTSWSWDFGDGNSSTEQNPIHTYQDAGTYTVALTVTGPGGSDTETKVDYITVSTPAPVADFSGTPTSGDKPLDVTFTDESTGEVSSWSWDFGDGNSSTEQNPVHTYQDAGTYTVALTVTGPGGSDTETKVDYITVTTPAPVADFSGTPTSGDKPLDVTFTDESTGEVTSWAWDFGDGNSSTEQNPVHTYQDAGTYTVELVVTGPGGSDTETKIDYVTVDEPAPVAEFSGTPTNGNKPLEVTFTDESTGEMSSWSWDFGDGNSSTEQNPVHTYNNEGTYTVELTVSGPGGSDTETKTDYITVTVSAPVAEFSGTPTSGEKPLEVTFTDESTGEISSWSWDFGDGNSSTEQNPVHTYQDAGTYTVALTVTGPGGNDTETKVDYITVTTPAPVADFSGTPTSGDKPLDVTFTDESTGEVSSWSWDFGDGNSSTEQNPVHTYQDAGTYTVALTVTGPGGNDTETKVDYITVTTPAPVADFSGTPTSGDKPLDVTFTDESTGEVSSWAWDFGDGNSSTEQNPVHTYQDAGTYTVALTVTGPGGNDTESKVDYITVTTPAPVADFSGTPTSGNKPLLVNFTDESTGEVSTWSWDFGDGNSSNEQNPSHTYETQGTYTVALTVTGPGGNDTETKTDYITVTVDAPVAEFSGTPTSGIKPLEVTFTDESTGEITNWSWDFGDGNGSSEQNPVHTYNDAGVYTVALTVTGPGGDNTETKIDYITVNEPAPVADFSGTPTSGDKPLLVNFTDESTGGPVTSWSWTFGDGGTSTEQNPSHTYSEAGTYTVALTVTGPGGEDTETKTDYITVTEPAPVAEFSADPTNGNKPLDVQFTDESTGAITSWSWDFGDGNSSTEQNPSHTYTDQGTYNVTLTVVGPGGEDTEVKDDYINVTVDAPVAAFSGSPLSGPKSLDVDFTDESTGEIETYSWDFGDDGSSTDQNPTHTYTAAGTYTVALTVTGPGGSDTETKVDYITVTEPDIAVDPTSYDFGDVQVTKTEQTTITVRNEGDAQLSISDFSITGANADQFSIVSGGDPVDLDPEGTHEVVVQFAPTSEGAKTGALTITSNDDDESPLDVALTGNGTPEPTPDIAVDPTLYDFGNVQVTKSEKTTITVSNDGDALLSISDFSITGTNADQFSIVSGGDPVDLDPEETHEVVVQFAPTSEGAKTGALTITSNDPNESPLDVALSGNGTPEPQPDIVVDPQSIDFGTLFTGDTKVDSFSIKNTGDAVLNVSSVALTGTNADEFSLDSEGPFEIAVDDSQIVRVTFAPTSAGSKEATAVVTSNDPDEETVNVALSGMAEDPEPTIVVEPESVDFGSVVIGNSKTENVTVSNTGDAILHVTSTTIGMGEELASVNANGNGADEFTIVEGGAPFEVEPGDDHIIKVQFSPAVEGERNATLSISSDDPENEVVEVPLTGIGIFEPPVVTFYATPTSGYPELMVKFEDESEGNPTAWMWEFGDGSTSTQQNPTHIYRRPGRYDVTLTITTSVGDVVLEKENFIHVWGDGPLDHAPLALVDNNYASPKEGWEHAIDEDVSGWVGTTTAQDTPPMAIFEFKDGTTKTIDNVQLLTDTEVGYKGRWVESFSVYVSTTGIASGDFVKVLDGTKTKGDWESFSFNPVHAKYVKLVLNSPSSGWRQIGEFRVCPVRPVASAGMSSATATSPHEGNGVDASDMTLTVVDEDGSPMGGLTREDFYLYVHNGKPILSSIMETNTPGVYTTQIANLGGVDMSIEVMVNGVIIANPRITFTEPDLSLASLVLLEGSETVENEGWDNAIDGDTEDWDGTVSAEGAAPYAIFGFSDGSIKSVQKLNLLVDTNVGYANRWVKRFRVMVSTSGMKDTDFTMVYDGIQDQAKWQVHAFPAANAKYVKLVIDYPTTGIKQLGEIEIEVGDALVTDDLASDVQSIAGTPTSFVVKENYPNPFNPETRIEFALPATQQVRVMVFNQLGQLIRTLYDGQLQPGYHTMTWNGQNDLGLQVPSGTYFLHVQTDHEMKTLKMLMVK